MLTRKCIPQYVRGISAYIQVVMRWVSPLVFLILCTFS